MQKSISILCIDYSFVVISGGSESWDSLKSSTEVLNVSEAKPQWKMIEVLELPVPMSSLKGVILGPDFFISAGWGGSKFLKFLDKIMKMSCHNGTFQLETLATTLQVPRDSHVFLPLPASMAVCN